MYENLFVKLFKSLAPGRAAGGIFNLAASGGWVKRHGTQAYPTGHRMAGCFRHSHRLR